MAEAKLYYFNGRGLAERQRILLCIAGIKFEEVIMTERSQLEKLLQENALLFNQLPLLEIDGMKLVQTNATTRYLAARAGMDSKDPKTQAKINMYYEGGIDFSQIFGAPIFMMPEDQALKKAKEFHLPRYLPIFEKILQDNGTGYLVGNSITLADIPLFEALLGMVDYFGVEKLQDFPNLQKFYTQMNAVDGVKLYLEKYRKPKNTEFLTKQVHTVLAN